jgi:hypothetical protein
VKPYENRGHSSLTIRRHSVKCALQNATGTKPSGESVGRALVLAVAAERACPHTALGNRHPVKRKAADSSSEPAAFIFIRSGQPGWRLAPTGGDKLKKPIAEEVLRNETDNEIITCRDVSYSTTDSVLDSITMQRSSD